MAPLDLSTVNSCVYPSHADQIDKTVELKDLAGLPQEIQNKLQTYLASRLNAESLRALKFREGAFYDPVLFQDVVRFQRDLHRDFVAYVVLFTFPLSNGQEYCTGVHLTVDGAVVLGIGLPNVLSDPLKAHVLSEPEALEVATRLGVARERASSELSYSSKLDSLVWGITEPTGHEGNRVSTRTCYVNAHTGRLLGWSTGYMVFGSLPMERPNYCMQRTADRLAGVISTAALAGRR
jgi:hypothetical protein